jgi:hypothetical protein
VQLVHAARRAASASASRISPASTAASSRSE